MGENGRNQVAAKKFFHQISVFFIKVKACRIYNQSWSETIKVLQEIRKLFFIISPKLRFLAVCWNLQERDRQTLIFGNGLRVAPWVATQTAYRPGWYRRNTLDTYNEWTSENGALEDVSPEKLLSTAILCIYVTSYIYIYFKG